MSTESESTTNNFFIRNASPEEFEQIGELLVNVYSSLPGFPPVHEQPGYYQMLRDVGQLTSNPNIELLVCTNEMGIIGGVVVFIHDMKDYGSGGTATQEKNACGFRLLAVSPDFRGAGIGKLLTQHCIEKAQSSNSENLIIHTTDSMKLAWGMYERLGFQRALDLDFLQIGFPVYGFRLKL